MRNHKSLSVEEFRARLEQLCAQSARDLEHTRQFVAAREAGRDEPRWARALS